MSESLLDYNDFGSVCNQLIILRPDRGSRIVEDYSYKVSLAGSLVKQSFYWAFLADIDLPDIALPTTFERSKDWWDISLRILAADWNISYEYRLPESPGSTKTELFIDSYSEEGGAAFLLHECNEEVLEKVIMDSLLTILKDEVAELKAELGDDRDPVYFIHKKKMQVITANRKAAAYEWEKKIHKVLHSSNI